MSHACPDALDKANKRKFVILPTRSTFSSEARYFRTGIFKITLLFHIEPVHFPINHQVSPTTAIHVHLTTFRNTHGSTLSPSDIHSRHHIPLYSANGIDEQSSRIGIATMLVLTVSGRWDVMVRRMSVAGAWLVRPGVPSLHLGGTYSSRYRMGLVAYPE